MKEKDGGWALPSEYWKFQLRPVFGFKASYAISEFCNTRANWPTYSPYTVMFRKLVRVYVMRG